MQEHEEVLLIDKLHAGDRLSILTAGLLVSEALKKSKICVITYDVLGRVILMPPKAALLTSLPRLKDEELDSVDEDRAIALMVAEERSEEEILKYLGSRNVRT